MVPCCRSLCSSLARLSCGPLSAPTQMQHRCSMFAHWGLYFAVRAQKHTFRSVAGPALGLCMHAWPVLIAAAGTARGSAGFGCMYTTALVCPVMRRDAATCHQRWTNMHAGCQICNATCVSTCNQVNHTGSLLLLDEISYHCGCLLCAQHIAHRLARGA